MNPFSLSISRFRWIGRVCRASSLRSQVLATLLSALLLASPLPAAADAASGPAATLAMVYRDDVDPAAYWVSEKLDGVRALWDGRVLRFRSGQPIAAPQWFLDGLPRAALDGELWIGRRSFEQLSGVVRKQQAVDDEWRQVRYMVFEMPEAPGSFTERIARIRAVTAGGPPWLDAVY